MNAPRVVRRIRGDFTANVHVLGRLVPGRSKTTHYDPYHGAGLIVWLAAVVNAVFHAGRSDKGQWLMSVVVKQDVPDCCLARAYVPDERVYQRLGFGLLVGHAPKIFTPLALFGARGQVEGQERTPVLLGHFDQQ